MTALATLVYVKKEENILKVFHLLYDAADEKNELRESMDFEIYFHAEQVHTNASRKALSR